MIRALVAAAVCLMVAACGTEAHARPPEDALCPTGCVLLTSSRDATDCLAGDPECCEADTEACADGGRAPAPVGAVSLELVNSTGRQATFYVDGGGPSAITTYHETRWLDAGARTTIKAAMTGPVGGTLTMATMVAAENSPHYTLRGDITVLGPALLCTITAFEGGDGFVVLAHECARA